MSNQAPVLRLGLDPRSLGATIDNAVFVTSEIVNFHLNALEGADLAKHAEQNLRFRLRGPEMGVDQRKAIHQSWILAKAFQELLRAVRQSLEEAYLIVTLLTKKHRTKSNATLSDFLEPFKKNASNLVFPKLLNAVNEKLNPKIDFLPSYISLQTARNCLEHRVGVVSKIETGDKDHFEMHIPRMKVFYIRRGVEIEIEPDHLVDPGDDRSEVDVLMKLDQKKRTFALGDRIHFTATEFSEIAFACHLLGQQLSSRLPVPIID